MAGITTLAAETSSLLFAADLLLRLHGLRSHADESQVVLSDGSKRLVSTTTRPPGDCIALPAPGHVVASLSDLFVTPLQDQIE